MKKRVTFTSDVSSDKKQRVSVSIETMSTPDLSEDMSSQDDDEVEEKSMEMFGKQADNKPRMSSNISDLVKLFEQRRSEASLSVPSNHMARNRRMSVKRVT